MSVDGAALRAALARAARCLVALRETLNTLDAAVGDGDCGLTMSRGGTALAAFVQANAPGPDLGGYLVSAGAAFNAEAPSTLGTVIATGLMAAGKEARGRAALDLETLARMMSAADAAIQRRGDVSPGDKTIVDALHPAAAALAASAGDGLAPGAAFLAAARRGRDEATALVGRRGRAAWMGERSRGLEDPGTVMLVATTEAVLDATQGAGTTFFTTKT